MLDYPAWAQIDLGAIEGVPDLNVLWLRDQRPNISDGRLDYDFALDLDQGVSSRAPRRWMIFRLGYPDFGRGASEDGIGRLKGGKVVVVDGEFQAS
jgi:hypothetical protein